MNCRPTQRFTLLLLIALVALAPACSKEQPPAPTPQPPPAAPTPAPRDTSPPAEAGPADEWEESEAAPQTFLSPDEINARQLLKTIYFDYDRAEIRADQRATLQANAAWLRDNATVRILVEGNCDERGTREYNLALGDRRAQATRDYLVSLGIAMNRIEIVSFGEERPAASGENEEAWEMNRRSDFVAIGSGGTNP